MEFKERRAKLVQNLKKSFQSGIVFMVGSNVQCRDDTDVELQFRQESNFLYLTNVQDIHNAALTLDIATGKFCLFVPRISEDEAIWIGVTPTLEELKKKYSIDGHDEIAYLDTLDLKSKNYTRILVLPFAAGHFSLKSLNDVDTVTLKAALDICRLFKSPFEIEAMRKINHISSNAHMELMRHARSLVKKQNASETDFAALWYSECMQAGLFHQAYGPIVAYGEHAAFAHYHANNGPILNSEQFLLVDAGAEMDGYASDITRTYPLSGKFTQDQKMLYNTVLTAQNVVLAQIKPGVEWEDLHRLATKVICEGLITWGVIVPHGVSVEDLCWKYFIPQTFFPHGLGHSIGLDVHDVGGYPAGVERIQEPGIKFLRMRRKLEVGMVVTVEPGCYFVDGLIRKMTPEQLKFIDANVLKRVSGLGGVRIEDCVVVTEKGHDNLTIAVKEISDIEKLMSC